MGAASLVRPAIRLASASPLYGTLPPTQTGPGDNRGPSASDVSVLFRKAVVQRLKTWMTFIGAPKAW